MADTTKGQAQGGVHHLAFPLLKLTVEIRLRIYEFVFSGSRITYVPERWPIWRRRARRRLSQAFDSSPHFRLLLTCRLIYQEARATYWNQTTLACALDVFVETPAAMTDFAKAHIKEIDINERSSTPRVQIESLRPKFCMDIGPDIVMFGKKLDSDTERALQTLSDFSNLKAVLLPPGTMSLYYKAMHEPTSSELTEVVACSPDDGLLRAIAKDHLSNVGSRATPLLRVILVWVESYGVDTHGLLSPKPGSYRKKCFLNYTTGKFFSSDDVKTDEEGFQMVLEDPAADTVLPFWTKEEGAGNDAGT